MDASISECLHRMCMLADAIEASDEKMSSAELWMRLEHIQLGRLLRRRESPHPRPGIDWTWIPPS